MVQEAASLEQTAPKKENVRETAASACEKAHKEAHKETHKEAGTVASDNGQKKDVYKRQLIHIFNIYSNYKMVSFEKTYVRYAKTLHYNSK